MGERRPKPRSGVPYSRGTSPKSRSTSPHARPQATRGRSGSTRPGSDSRARASASRKNPSAATSQAKPAGRGGASRRTASSPPAAKRFDKRFNVTFSRGERTRQFSVRMLAVLFFAALGIVIVSGPLSQYLDQQQQKRDLLQQLDQTTARVDVLEQELARWKDNDFVRSQARERLGYVLPGETLYLVSDPAEGTPEQIVAERTKEANDRRRQATPFYVTMWDSIKIAGATGGIENPSNVPVIGSTTPPAPPSPTAPASGAPAQVAGETATEGAN